MAASNANNTSTFMEEIQRYECLYNKFSKDYKNRRTRENAWETIGQKFGLTAEEAEKKYKNIRTSYTRYLKKVKSVPSGSGRDAVPKTGEFANLQWLDQHISHRKSASNWSNHDSDEEEASQLQEDVQMNNSSSSTQSHENIDDTEQGSADSPASSESRPRSSSNQSPTNANEVAEVVNPKKPTASALKTTKRSWAAANRQKGSTKEDIDLAMMQIAQELLQEPSEKTPSVDDDDEEMLFARSFAKRLKKLPERAKAFVRIQLEQIMFQAEFAPAQQYPAPVNPMHMGYNHTDYQPQYGHHPCSSDCTPNLQSL